MCGTTGMRQAVATRRYRLGSYIAPSNKGMKRNVPIVGFVIGILLPLLGFAIMYVLWGHGMAFGKFMNVLLKNNKEFGKVLTMSLLVNLAPFVYCNTKRYDQTMQGIVVATMLYAVLIVLIMFVW